MKTIYLNLKSQTAEFNLFTRVMIFATLIIIAAGVISLIVGLAIQGEPRTFSY